MRGNKSEVKAESFHPIKNNVFVTDLDHGPTMTAGGIIRPDDNMTDVGVRPRWARVWAIGPEVEDIQVGEWVFVQHARWTNSIDLNLAAGKVRVWKIDYPEGALLATDKDPREQRLELPDVKHLQSSKHNSTSKAPAIIRSRN